MGEATVATTRTLPQFAAIQDTAKIMFLDAYLETASIREALKFSGASRPAFMAWRSLDIDFSNAFDRCRAMVGEHLEEEAFRRAYEGVEREVFHQGEVCGSYRDYSDTLMVLLLKANFPERYMDRFAGSVSGDQEVADRLTMGRKRVQEMRGQRQLGTVVVAEPSLRAPERALGKPQAARELPVRVLGSGASGKRPKGQKE